MTSPVKLINELKQYQNISSSALYSRNQKHRIYNSIDSKCPTDIVQTRLPSSHFKSVIRSNPSQFGRYDSQKFENVRLQMLSKSVNTKAIMQQNHRSNPTFNASVDKSHVRFKDDENRASMLRLLPLKEQKETLEERKERLKQFIKGLQQLDVCLLPDLDVLIECAQEEDLIWFDIFDENMKECNNKNRYQFQYANIHDKDKKKDMNVYEQFTNIGLFRIRNKFEQSKSVKQTRAQKNLKIYQEAELDMKKKPSKKDGTLEYTPAFMHRLEFKKMENEERKDMPVDSFDSTIQQYSAGELMNKLKVSLLQMINKYRHNTTKFKREATRVKDNALYNSLQKELLMEQDDLKFKKDSSPRKRALQKIKKQETEYERKVKQRFLERQKELTYQQYAENKKHLINQQIIDKFCVQHRYLRTKKSRQISRKYSSMDRKTSIEHRSGQERSERLSDSEQESEVDYGKTPYHRHQQNVMDKVFYS